MRTRETLEHRSAPTQKGTRIELDESIGGVLRDGIAVYGWVAVPASHCSDVVTAELLAASVDQPTASAK